MSGHSKWSTIKHKKAAADAKRGKIFTTIAKELTIAARDGGGDPEFNPGLRLAIDKAKAANMPKDNVERAIKRGTGEIEGGQLEEVIYEGYAPHGVGVIVECVTDNRNRAVAEVRHVLSKAGGNMATAGAVLWQFTQKGYLASEKYGDSEEFFLLAAEAGAEDVEFSDGLAEIFVEKENFGSVRNALEEAGVELEEANLLWDPNNPRDLSPNQAAQVLRLVEALEELDDVQNVFSALNITDEALAELA